MELSKKDVNRMSNNLFRLTMKLEQYTPMLHFQGKQKGACLRATEVKPQLDRFVLDYLRRQNLPQDHLPKEWFIRHEPAQNSYALRYQLRFAASGSSAEQDKAHPLYFGDMGENKGKITSVFYPDGVELTVLCLTKQTCRAVEFPDGKSANTLLGILERLLPPFFAVHCFGTRSNKGFGSFGVKGGEVERERLIEYLPESCREVFQFTYQFTYKEKREKPDDRLDDVYVLSGMLKGGFNRPYYKGEIQKALRDKGIGSEKAFLKQQVFNRDDLEWYRKEVCRGNDRTPDTTYSDYRFLRAWLGLTLEYPYGVGKKSRVFSFEPKDTEIKRFPSPVRYKPEKDALLVLVCDIPEVMAGAEFTIRGKSIFTPTAEELDFVGFVRDCFKPFGETPRPGEWVELAKGKFGKEYRTFDYQKSIYGLELTGDWRRRDE